MKDADAPARASLCDLLEVTRRVMAPVEANGTFWCQEVDAHQMVEWTLSELAEVEEEIRAAEDAMATATATDATDATDASDADGASSSPGATGPKSELAVAARKRVQDELGDLVFDVIMLGCMCERRFGAGNAALAGEPNTFRVSLAAAVRGAADKVKRRCPYSFGPAAGPCPSRAAEKESWTAAKRLEKAHRAGGPPPPPAPPTRRRGEEGFGFGSTTRFSSGDGVRRGWSAGALTACAVGMSAVAFAGGFALGGKQETRDAVKDAISGLFKK